jgi:hypothetical protein
VVQYEVGAHSRYNLRLVSSHEVSLPGGLLRPAEFGHTAEDVQLELDGELELMPLCEREGPGGRTWVVRATIRKLTHRCEHSKTLHVDACGADDESGVWADLARDGEQSSFVFEHSSAGEVDVTTIPLHHGSHLPAFQQTLARALSVPAECLAVSSLGIFAGCMFTCGGGGEGGGEEGKG